ncbi:hypothetical protein [Aurantiacibacter sediminis]|uniref:Uncharacterized protein n=1 Tax=Aurantiacibacter sediminis TaxID=2793064 RepID=A0ABS0N2R6_9SPHN|nr:hypothetical protein [Aurantiacibacter sediminis]MBH5322254.1 hypothetical protein [Aurantiacibacter sediminis]
MKFGLLCGALAIAAIPATAFAHEILHSGHEHAHGDDCGHQAVEHAGHVDYLHDGHLHNPHDGHTDEHSVDVTSTNPEAEALVEHVAHDEHDHEGSEAMHAVVQHGAHYDYVHDGRLHHPHGNHVDDHGPLTPVAAS